MLSLLKVKRQIDSDQLIYVQGFWEQSREQRREESAAGRDESRARKLVETGCREEAPVESKAERRQRRNASRKRDAKRERKPRAMTA